MGKYGIDDRPDEELTEEDRDKMILETTKIIEARRDAREVAYAFYDRAWVNAERNEHEKAHRRPNLGLKDRPRIRERVF
jgi:hypothetical protein